MSLKWEDIDLRQQKSKQSAIELKQFLLSQNEESKSRKLREKEREREFYKHSMGINHHKAQQFAKIDSKHENGASKSQITPQEDTDNVVSAYDPVALESDSLRYSHQRSLPESFIIGSLSARMEQLQDASQRDSQRIQDLFSSMGHKERVNEQLLNQITSRLENESKKVETLLLEFKKRDSIFEADSKRKDLIISDLKEQIHSLGRNLHTFVQKSNEFTLNLNSTNQSLQLETVRSTDACKTIQLHDQALSNLTVLVNQHRDSISQTIHSAASELIQKIENEGRARRGLEESIRSDAQEFRKIIERVINDRLQSIQAYTDVRAQSDRQELERVLGGLNSKLINLEEIGISSQEALANTVNQRLESIETMVGNSEKETRRIEERLNESVNESIKLFEELMLKGEQENERKFHKYKYEFEEFHKWATEALARSEKSTKSQNKYLEEVIRAEIKARMTLKEDFADLQHKVKKLSEDTSKSNVATSQRLDELHALVQNLGDSEEQRSKQFETKQKQSRQYFEEKVDAMEFQLKSLQSSITEISTETKSWLKEQSKNFDMQLEANTAKFETNQKERDDARLQKDIEIVQNTEKACNDLKLSFSAKSVQYEAAIEAFQHELSQRASVADLKAYVDEIYEEIENHRIQIAQEYKAKSNAENSFIKDHIISAERLEGLEARAAKFEAAIQKLSDNSKVIEETVNPLNTRVEALMEGQEAIEEILNQNSTDIHNIQEYKEVLAVIQRKQTNLAELSNELKQTIDTEALELGKELKKVAAKFEGDLRVFESSQSTEIDLLKSKVTELAQTITQQKEIVEDACTDARIQVTNALDLSGQQQDELKAAIFKKLQTVEMKLTTKLDDLQLETTKEFNQATTKLNNHDKRITAVDEEVDRFKEDLQKFMIKLKKDVNLIEGELNSNSSLLKRFDTKSTNHSVEIEQIKSQITTYERSLTTKIAEISTILSSDHSYFTAQLQQLGESEHRKNRFIEEKLNELQQKTDLIQKNVRSYNIEIAKLSTASNYMNDNRQSIQKEQFRIEEMELLEKVIGPLESKLDGLVEQLNNIQNKTEEGHSKVVPSTFYKPSHIQRRPKTNANWESSPSTPGFESEGENALQKAISNLQSSIGNSGESEAMNGSFMEPPSPARSTSVSKENSFIATTATEPKNYELANSVNTLSTTPRAPTSDKGKHRLLGESLPNQSKSRIEY